MPDNNMWLRWQKGRQKSGYDKFLIAALPWPIPFDCYLLRFPTGSEIKPHTDPVTSKKHYRLNWVVKPAKSGGHFVCSNCIVRKKSLFVFRPDENEHSVSQIKQGTRYVLSVGWARSA